jgi:hypothetical protein
MFEKKVAEYTTGAPEGSKRKSRGKISSVANWIEWVKRNRPTDHEEEEEEGCGHAKLMP